MEREEKQRLVAELQESMGRAKVAFLTRFTGLNVEKMTKIRQELKRADVELRVIKNNLFRLAIKGTDKESLTQKLEGPLAVAWSDGDLVVPARLLTKFSKEFPELQIVGASFNGKLWGPGDVQSWVNLPTLEEIRAKIISLIQAPASSLLRLLTSPGSRLAQLLRAKTQEE
ncbi:MAG: 50S ribosomal protein L10 [Thermodesulfobacteriota bacterium]